MDKKLIIDGKFEIIGVKNPTTFVFEGTEYRWDYLTEAKANELIVAGFPYLKKVIPKPASGSADKLV